jgi:hypothetical protein
MSKQNSCLKWSVRIIAVLALVACTAGQAQATVSGTVWFSVANAGNATIANAPTSGTSSTFTSTAINYGSPPGNNTIGSFLNSPQPANTFGLPVTPAPTTTFLSNPGIAGDQLSFGGSLTTGTYVLLTGTVTVAAGTNNIQIIHDDGAQLALNGTIVIDSPSPTSARLDQATVAAGTYTFQLAYGEVNGLPADLSFYVNGAIVTGVVPEPSTMAIGAVGAIGFIAYGLRRRKARTA